MASTTYLLGIAPKLCENRGCRRPVSTRSKGTPENTYIGHPGFRTMSKRGRAAAAQRRSTIAFNRPESFFLYVLYHRSGTSDCSCTWYHDGCDPAKSQSGNAVPWYRAPRERIGRLVKGSRSNFKGHIDRDCASLVSCYPIAQVVRSILGSLVVNLIGAWFTLSNC